MSKQADSNLFIFSSIERIEQVVAFYQRLVGDITGYEELGNRVLKHIRTAYAFRQVEQARELARVLINIPIREFQLIGQYYLIWCKCRESEYQIEGLERVIEQTETYKSKALISRGSFELCESRPETALHFYTEALKTSLTMSDHVVAARSIAATKAIEGFHASALRDIERLLPLVRHAEPLTYYEVLNSYAVELTIAGRVTEACQVINTVLTSPFVAAYPEWQETLEDVRSKHRKRSTVTISRPQTEEDCKAQPDILDSAIQKARVQAVIDFMNANLHKQITVAELAKIVHISPSRLHQLFKIHTGFPPIEYLIRLRMQKAHELLTTRFESIKEIMAMVGYGNKNNFARHFKRYYGFAPSEYRRRTFTR